MGLTGLKSSAAGSSSSWRLLAVLGFQRCLHSSTQVPPSIFKVSVAQGPAQSPPITGAGLPPSPTCTWTLGTVQGILRVEVS